MKHRNIQGIPSRIAPSTCAAGDEAAPYPAGRSRPHALWDPWTDSQVWPDCVDTDDAASLARIIRPHTTRSCK